MVGLSDLGITVTAQPAVVYVGQNVTYTLTVSNQGPNDEPDAVVTCLLPSDVAFASASYEAGWSPTLALGMLTADLGPLASGATVVATVVLVPQAAAAGTFTMSFSIQGQNADLSPMNNTANATVTVTPAADLEGRDLADHRPGRGRRSVELHAHRDEPGIVDRHRRDGDGSPAFWRSVYVGFIVDAGHHSVVSNGVLSADLGTIKAGGTATITVGVIPVAVETLSARRPSAAASSTPTWGTIPPRSPKRSLLPSTWPSLWPRASKRSSPVSLSS